MNEFMRCDGLDPRPELRRDHGTLDSGGVDLLPERPDADKSVGRIVIAAQDHRHPHPSAMLNRSCGRRAVSLELPGQVSRVALVSCLVDDLEIWRLNNQEGRSGGTVGDIIYPRLCRC